MFFNDWMSLARIAIVGVLAYVLLIGVLRVTGKRTLSKWNAFDFIVTIALGSTLATVLLSKDVTLADGVLALALLTVLQLVITWCAVRSPGLRRLIKSTPTLLFDRGAFMKDALIAQRVTESEIRAAVRGAGHAAMEDIEAVVLETDGSVSVVARSPQGSRSSLVDVGND